MFSQSRSEPLAALGVEVVTGSVTDPAAVARAVDGVSHIYHLAGFVSRKPEDAPRMYEVHVEGTRAAVRGGPRGRACAASWWPRPAAPSPCPSGPTTKPDETCPAPLALIARWPYYASKYYQEEAARRACGDGWSW